MKKKKETFLKFIIAYKAFLGIIELTLAASIYKHLGDTVEETFTSLAKSINLNANHQFVSSAIKKAGVLGTTDIMLGFAAVIFALGVCNFIEAVGLHYRQRWAEWLTVVATGIFIPYELYTVIEHVTILKVIVLIINIAIVYYLGKHKELFGNKKVRVRAAVE